MSLSAEIALCPAGSQTLSATLLTSKAGLEHLSEAARSLFFKQGTPAQPAFYLSSLIRRRWAAAVVAVWRSDKLAGIVYMKERKIMGFRTGIYYGDATLNALVVSEPEARREVLRAAMNVLLQRPATRAVRLLVPKDGYELDAIDQIAQENTLEVRSKPVSHHERLPLQANYEDFLSALGSKTRRNFRYFRRRFETLNHEYLHDLDLPNFRSAALSLLRKDVVGTETFGVHHALSVLGSVPQPLLCALRHKDGTWLSVLGGWYDSGRAVIIFQLNSSKDHAQLSLSVVMRSYVLEKLIEHGVRSVLFWGGMSDPLQRYSQAVPTQRFYLDKRDTGWRATQACLRSLNSLVPVRWAHYADWMLPPKGSG